MKLTIVKRLLATALTLAMTAGVLGTSVMAAGTVNEVKEKTGENGSIVVTVYDQTPGAAGTGAQISGLSNPVDGVGINALRIGSVVELTSTDGNGTVSTRVAFGLTDTYANLLGLDTNSAIASQGGTFYFAPTAVQNALKTANQTTIEAHLESAAEKKNDVTENNGIAQFDGLNYGLYLLAKSALPSDATTDLVPFLVSVPMYVESESGGDWTSTVYAYPKVRTADITISKTVDDQDSTTYANGDIYVNAGQTLKYTVTTTIPAAATGNGSANEFTSFVITDTNAGNTLDINQSTVEVMLNGTPLTLTEDYTVVYPGSQEGSSVLTITLTDTATTGGLAELNKDLSSQQTITLTYDATVATDVTFSSKLTNAAKATYQRSGMTAVADTDTATVDLYTYGIDLTKTLSDSGDIDENTISFELYKTNDGGTLSDPVPVESGNGSYWVAKSATEPDTNTYTMYVGANGKLNLYGLEPGTYYLSEIATMDGYTRLDAPITIVIADGDSDGTATATVNGADARVTGGVVYLSVENTKNELGFTLPQTGGTGTLVVTAIGLGMLCAGVILLVVYRRKGQADS